MIRRIRRTKNNSLVEQTDIRYGRVSGELVPTSWVTTEYTKAGSVSTSTTVEVINIRINEQPSSKEFEIVFPEDTRVHDQRNSKDYLVLADGSMREVDREGRKLSAVVSQDSDASIWRFKWTIGGLVMVACVIAARFFLRRRSPLRKLNNEPSS